MNASSQTLLQHAQPAVRNVTSFLFRGTSAVVADGPVASSEPRPTSMPASQELASDIANPAGYEAQLDAADAVGLCLVVMLGALLLVAVCCMYMDMEDDARSKRGARKQHRSGLRRDGERAAAHRPVVSMQASLQPAASATEHQLERRGMNVEPPSLPARSSAGSLRSDASAVGSSRLPRGSPPALYSALVLPHCETWFAAPWQHIGGAAPSFDFMGRSGKALLRVQTTTDASGLRTSRVSVPLGSGNLLGTCSGRKGGPIEIFDANEHLYGDLRRHHHAGDFCVVHRSNVKVVTVSFQAYPKSHMVFSGGDGAQIAVASRCVESECFECGEHLEVKVMPGEDAILVLCCFLGIFLIEGVDMPRGFGLGAPSSSV